MWERERSYRARSGEYGASRSVGISFSAKKSGIPKSIRRPVCLNAQSNRYFTNLVHFFKSLLVILLTPESRIVGLLSDLVVLAYSTMMIPATSKTISIVVSNFEFGIRSSFGLEVLGVFGCKH